MSKVLLPTVPCILRNSIRKRIPSLDHHLSPFLGFHSKRLQSTHSDDRLCKFITAASCMGKPVSEQELIQVKRLSEGAKHKLMGYTEWVEMMKKKWADDYLNRYPGEPTPSYERLTNSGQDWWFIHERNHENFETFMGVADGVGGWLDSGIDPAQVSQGLMFYSDQILKIGNKNNHTTKKKREIEENPNSILTRAYEKMLIDDQIQGGASTALIAKLDGKNASLDWTNLGDSSLMLINPKEKKILTRSNSQTHYFNCPYQLTKFPNNYEMIQDGSFVPDTPHMADSGTFTSLQDGDLILLYTDGLGDNLWPEEILDIIHLTSEKKMPDSQFVRTLADTITLYSRIVSLKKDRVSPFEIEARKNKIFDLKGGKVDDVTLIVSLVRHINP